jgi:hypothetical protein
MSHLRFHRKLRMEHPVAYFLRDLCDVIKRTIRAENTLAGYTEPRFEGRTAKGQQT